MKLNSYYINPWILDSAEKVAWANAVLVKINGEAWAHPKWKLGDTCYYTPPDELLKSTNP
jgi:hypothetical protein